MVENRQLYLIYVAACCLLFHYAGSVIDFTIPPMPTPVIIPQNVKLDCQAKDIPSNRAVTYSWLYNDQPISAGLQKASVFANNSLFIPNILRSDVGNYTCHAAIQGESTNITVAVVEAYLDTFKINPSSATVIDGNGVSLQCVSGYGAPPPVITWERNGLAYIAGTQSTATFGTPRFDSGEQRSSLLQFKAAKHLEGEYRCVARNPLSGDTVRSNTGRLTVTLISRLPYIESPVQEAIIIPANRAFSLPCPILGQPSPILTWYKNNSIISNSSSVFILQNGTLYFPNVLRSHSGKYKCKGQNSLGNMETNYTKLTVAYLDLHFKLHPSDVSAIAGRPATVRCSPPDSVPPATVVWYKDYHPVSERAGAFALTVLSSGDLYFSSIQQSDQGQYFCVARNEHSIPSSRTSNSSSLTIKARPVFTEPPLAQTVVKNHLLRLFCKVQGDPFPEVKWYKDDSLLHAESRISFRDSNQQLLISNMNKIDEGQYKCTATNDYGTSTSPAVFVRVIIPPEIIQSVLTVSIKEGETLLLPCAVYGDPQPVVQWFKDDVPIKTDNRVHQLEQGLQFTHILASDAGLYRCLATNSGGSKESFGRLTVHLIPTFTTYPSDRTVNQSQTVTFSCQAKGNPFPTISWLFNNASQLPTGIHVSGNNSELVIHDVHQLHNGEYTCQAQNIVGSSYKKGKLSVQVPPLISNITGQFVIGRDATLSLNCLATGKPIPQIMWYKDNTVIMKDVAGRIDFPQSSNLHIRFMKKQDEGVYKCQASNAAGINERTQQVYVRDPPLPPALDRVQSISTMSVNVSWSPVAQSVMNEETFYVIEFKTSTSLVYQRHRGIVHASESWYEITGLQPAIEYLFRMASGNEIGVGTFGSPLSAKTFETAPSPPRNLKVLGKTSMTIRLSWEIPTVKNGEIAYYRIIVKDENNDEKQFTINKPVFPTQTFELKNLWPYTFYIINVQGATIEQGITLWGNLSTGVLTQTLKSKPSKYPSGVTIEAISDSIIQVEWQTIPVRFQHGRVRGYLITYSLVNSSLPMQTVNVTSGDVTSVNITNLLPWQLYSFQVTAYNDVGQSPPSDVVYHRTSAKAPSAAPGNLKVNAISPYKIKVTWISLDPSRTNSIIAGYIIQISDAENNTVALRVNSSLVEEETVDKLRPWHMYTIRVKAYTNQIEQGSGPWTEAISIRTLEGQPGPVHGLTYRTLDSYTISLSWKSPLNPNGVIKEYVITYRGEPLVVSTTSATETTSNSIDNSTLFTVQNGTMENTTETKTGNVSQRRKRSVMYLQRNDSLFSGKLSTNDTFVTIGNLQASMVYNISVVAVTSAGEGPELVYVMVITGQPTAAPTTGPLHTTTTSVALPTTTEVPAVTASDYGLIRPQDLPFVIFGATVGGLIITIIMVIIIVLLCLRNKKKSKPPQSKYFIPPSQVQGYHDNSQGYYDNSQNDQISSENTQRKPRMYMDSSSRDETDNPYALSEHNTFHMRKKSNGRRPDHVKRVKKKGNRRRDSNFDSVLSQEPRSSGIDNEAFENSINNLDKNGRQSVNSLTTNDSKFSLDDLDKKSYVTRIPKESAVAIAMDKSRKTMSTPNDTESLINNEAEDDERTAL